MLFWVKTQTYTCMCCAFLTKFQFSRYSQVAKDNRMIKVVWNVVKKIFGVVFCILSPLKRLICRRKRHSSDTVLPLVNHYAVPIDVTHSVPSNTEVCTGTVQLPSRHQIAAVIIVGHTSCCTLVKLLSSEILYTIFYRIMDPLVTTMSWNIEGLNTCLIEVSCQSWGPN